MPQNTPSINADFHCHTIASDGKLSPMELIDLAASHHVDMLAITDHDTIAGYQQVVEYAQQANINLISGVEISTTWAGQGIHVVGLNFDANHVAMTTLLAAQQQARRARCQIILDKLAKRQMPMSFDEVQLAAGHGHIGRPHIAQTMIDKGYVQDMNRAFKKYLGAGKIGDVKSGWAPLEQTITAINDSGGIAVIAHPDKYKMTRMKLLRLVDEFIQLGGQGIEVISAKQTSDVTAKYLNIANEKQLYASIGSDFHRPFPQLPDVGQMPQLPKNCRPVWEAFNH